MLHVQCAVLQIEEFGRRRIWEENLEMISVHNLEVSLGLHSYELAMNHLGDLVSEGKCNRVKMSCFKLKLMHQVALSLQTIEELIASLTGTVAPVGLERIHYDLVKINTSVPESVDWREGGLVTSVKTQVTGGRTTKRSLQEIVVFFFLKCNV